MFSRCIVCCVVLIAGCGRASYENAAPSIEAGGALGLAEAKPNGAASEQLPGSDRKIIYEAEVKLVARDFSSVESAISKLVKEHNGYLADVSIDRTSGEQRFGRWEARIPVGQFDAFLAALSELGVPETRSQTAQDVTEEYVDLEARITNKKRLEERILALLENSEGDIKDVIEIEHELARVRGEVEQMEGRLRYLTNRTALTTVVIVAREQRDYVPPESPTYLTRIRDAWGNSLLLLRNLGEGVTVAAVFAFPWIIVLLIVVAPPLWYVRRCRPFSSKIANSEQLQGPAPPDQPVG